MVNKAKLSKLAIALGVVIAVISVIMLMFITKVNGATDSTVAEGIASLSVTSYKAIASAIAIGVAAFGGAISMAIIGSKAVEGIARQPEAEGKIRTTFMLGLVFIETAIIYALLVVILIIFVL